MDQNNIEIQENQFQEQNLRKRFQGQVAIVTGGSSGIGKATAQKFAQEGAQVVILDIQKEEGQKTADEINKDNLKQCQYIYCDISKEIEVKSSFEESIKIFGQINVLVNNAAYFQFGKIEEITEEQWDKVLSVNIKGYALCTKYAVIQMKKQKTGGSIVNLASVNSFIGNPEMVPYTTTKTAILGLTRATAKDLAPYNIRVNAVAPGAIKTPASENLAIQNFGSWEKFNEENKKAHMLSRVGQPIEVANAILFLASDDASFITAETLMVDGGYIHQ